MAKKASKSKSKAKGTAGSSNYSKKLRDLLNEKSINVGDYVILKDGDGVVKGYLLPQTELGSSSVFIIKQDNGYNVGIKYSENLIVEKGKDSLELESFPKVVQEQKQGLPEISLFATGGTIASRIDYKTGGVVWASKPEEVFANLPELFEEVGFRKMKQLFQIGSEDIGYKQWQILAENVAEELNEGVKGAVIMHGTDMMGYSSAALSFMLEDLTKPVVFAGGQRSSDRGSFDGALNLISAARAAANGDFAHVMVSMHETSDDNSCLLSPGTNVRKMHTSRRDAFKTINSLPIARVTYNGEILELRKDINRRREGKVIAKTEYEKKVALVKIFPGIDPTILEWYVDQGYRGIVIEGTGLGHVPTFPLEKKRGWIPYLKMAKKEGLLVGMTSQCLNGRVHPYVYIAGRTTMKAGVTYLGDMLPETAIVKMGWVLGQTDDLAQGQKMMQENLRGELSPKSLYGGYC